MDKREIEIKETLIHGTFECPKLHDGPTKVLYHLKMLHLTSNLVTATDLALYPQTGNNALDITLNAVLLVYLHQILAIKDNNDNFDALAISTKIRHEIRSINTLYPN